MKGPRAQEALLSLALAEQQRAAPSKSRKFTSLPSVAPTIGSAGIDGQDDLRLRVVPAGFGMDADIRAGADAPTSAATW